MKLSEHLSLSEIERSDIATYLGIENKLPEGMIPVWKRIASEIFEPLREAYGEPIIVTSGYRSDLLNSWLIKHRGASENSQHRGFFYKEWPTQECETFHCAALDLWVSGSGGRKKMLDICLEYDYLKYDQLISEFPENGIPAWIHISHIEGLSPRCERFISIRRQDGAIKYEAVPEM